VKGSKIRCLLSRAVFTLVLSLIFACSGQNGRKVTQQAEAAKKQQGAILQADISFDTLAHDFGTIIEGEMVVCYFDYENLGPGDLIISSVEATCGCTTPDWSKEPLKAGGRARLKVVFDAHGRSGSQLKSVKVFSNSLKPEISLTIQANVTNNK